MTAHDHERGRGGYESPLGAGLDPARTALVLVDLMERMVALPLAPRPGAGVVTASLGLAAAFRAAGAPVVAVRGRRAGPHGRPPGSDLVPEVAAAADLVVDKPAMGAFQDTELHPRLAERGVRTLVLAGIATNLAVESTARAAADLGYGLVLARDAMSGLTAAEHEAAVALDFPRFGTVVTASQVHFA